MDFCSDFCSKTAMLVEPVKATMLFSTLYVAQKI